MPYRNSLRPIIDSTAPEHAGLWFDRYLSSLSPEDTDSKRNLVSKTTDICPNGPPHYANAFNLWKISLQELGASMREAKVETRMVVGLGGESLIETSVTLHRTYGVPYIPGSALKGLAARWARTKLAESGWAKKGEGYLTLFGDTTSAGYVTFHDALYIPDSAFERKVLWPDVITVHHAEYYGSGRNAPTDWDSPTPVPFLTATGKYLIALSGPDEWVQIAFQILAEALKSEGVGGKTSRGYGRMTLIDRPSTTPSVTTLSGTNVSRDDIIDRISRLKQVDVANSIGQYVEKWKALKDKPEQARPLGQAIVDKVTNLWKNGTSKPWFTEIQQFLEQNPPT